MGYFPKKNLLHNQKICLPDGMLNGQGLGELSKMKYGCSTVSYSGCEVIAVYNARLLVCGEANFCETARYMERFRVLLGFWGSCFLTLGICLRHFGLKAKGTRSRKKLTDALSAGKPCLFVYWTRKRFRSSVHTVLIEPEASDHVRIYNIYNNCDHSVLREREAFIGGRMIVGYVIDCPAEEEQHESL
jgi:hypothetical protein